MNSLNAKDINLFSKAVQIFIGDIDDLPENLIISNVAIGLERETFPVAIFKLQDSESFSLLLLNLFFLGLFDLLFKRFDSLLSD